MLTPQNNLQPQKLGSQGAAISFGEMLQLLAQLDHGHSTNALTPPFANRLPTRAGTTVNIPGGRWGFSLGLPVEVRYGIMSLIGIRPARELIARAAAERAKVASLVPQELIDAAVAGIDGLIAERTGARSVGMVPTQGPGSMAYQEAMAAAERAMLEAAKPNPDAIRAAFASLGAFDARTQTTMSAASSLLSGLRVPAPNGGIDRTLDAFGSVAPLFMGADLLVEDEGQTQYAASLAARMRLPVDVGSWSALTDAEKQAFRRDPTFDESKLLRLSPLQGLPAWVLEAEAEIDSKLRSLN